MDISFFETKRTYRKFKQEPISADSIEKILEAGRLSSSGANRQVLKYAVVAMPDNVKKLNSLVKWAAFLPPEQGTPKPEEIPVMFIALIYDGRIGGASEVDAGIAMCNMTTMAWSMGIGSCMMGAIDRPAIKEMLNLSEEETVAYVVAFGYPSKKSTVVSVDTDTKYYLDSEANTMVPKRSLKEVVKCYM